MKLDEEFWKKYNELSYEEQMEFHRRVGWPLPDSDITKINISSYESEEPQKSDTSNFKVECIFVSTEDSKPDSSLLKKAFGEDGIIEDEEDEFLFHHLRPAWVISSETLQENQHIYHAELLLDSVIKLTVAYDRVILINLLKSIMTISSYIHTYANANCYPIHIESARQQFVRGDNLIGSQQTRCRPRAWLPQRRFSIMR